MKYEYSVRVIYPVTAVRIVVRAKDAEEALKSAKTQQRGKAQVDPLAWEVSYRGSMLLKDVEGMPRT